MLVIPAIDLKDHKVVRLCQGQMDQENIYSDSIVDTAKSWVEQGAKRLHIVDLNAAFAGEPFHLKEITELASTFPQIEFQVGGGIRDLDTISKYINAGISYCILGTVAVKKPEIVHKACELYPNKIILGVDAKDGQVKTEGWGEQSSVRATVLLQKFLNVSLESVVYTDISKDGMLQGMNFDQITEVSQCGIPIIASGGLTDLEDIKQLNTMSNIHGVIAGKAIYEKRFSLSDALALG
ncbi:1-(5-phosphoribosyl)-5-[(5-phosphoribosylamino)methylideneamino]imidazole-4-carboxamide isomerase [bacterium K02(2017)]|nr:1-(5-phosphoribosyl)-5-[(5-phosphoribosylamino)methylideneamino]imidazole-4-carboxamide isomerase [bacterium K02(2017)]